MDVKDVYVYKGYNLKFDHFLEVAKINIIVRWGNTINIIVNEYSFPEKGSV